MLLVLCFACFLKAEQDFKKQLHYDAEHEKEAHIMRNVPNWEVGKNIYSRRWMEPTPGLAEMNSFANPQLTNEERE